MTREVLFYWKGFKTFVWIIHITEGKVNIAINAMLKYIDVKMKLTSILIWEGI